MNRAAIISTLLIMATNSQGTFAEYTDTKKAGAFITSAVTGAVLGGPVGFVVGSLGGVWLGEELKQADQAEDYKRELTQVSDQVVDLNSQLQASKQKVIKYAEMAVKPFELQMLFNTNNSELTSTGKQQVKQLMAYLNDNPDVFIQLDGHADPRGTDQGNLLLSQERVDAIRSQLVEQGLHDKRIIGYSHGSNLSQATKDDLEAYAQERVVKIKIYRDENSPDVAQVSID